MDFALHFYDFLMLAVIVLSTVFGAWKGMAWQLAAVASLLLSAAVAVRLGDPLMAYIDLAPPWNRCVAMVALFLATSLAVWLLFRVVSGIIDRVRLKEFDRQIGALLGAAKGVLWCAVITFVMVVFVESSRPKVLRTYSGYYTARLIQQASPVLPPEIAEVLDRYIQEVRREQLDLENPPALEANVAAPGRRVT